MNPAKTTSSIIGFNFTGNFLADLPNRISEFSLTYLNLRNNNLSEFPNVVRRKLNPTYNYAYTKQIFSLSQLEVLDVCKNYLTEVPEDITKMKKLRFLAIRNNRLEDLPKSIGSADHLRIIKLDGNPLTDSLLSIVNGNQTFRSSPTTVSPSKHDTAVEITAKIKNFLKESSQQVDNEMSSQSESPLETPRVSKRISVRFPVKLANGSISESVREPRSPSINKPAIPTRSKQRIFSSSNGSPPVGRRPGVGPLNLGNERNRSHSESVVQATANARSKRMGMLSARKLDSLEETNTGRNSLHFRGSSHASALRDRHEIYRSALGSASTNSISPIAETSDDAFTRRLSSIPERRSENLNSKRLDQVARGLVFAMDVFAAHLKRLLFQIKEPQDQPLVPKFSAASLTLRKLDTALTAFDNTPPDSSKTERKAAKTIKKACTACISAHKELLEASSRVIGPLTQLTDSRYLRSLVLLFYTSCNEIYNSILFVVPKDIPDVQISAPQGKMTAAKSIQTQPPPRLTIQAANSAKPAITSSVSDDSRPFTAPARRFRSETLSSARIGNTIKPPLAPQSAVPLYARSRSSSRSNYFGPGSSMSNTPPRTGDSLQMPSSTYSQTPQDYEQGELERVYASIFATIIQCRTKMSELISKTELRKNIRTARELEAHQRIMNRFKNLRSTCEAIHKQMSKVKLNDPNTRRFKELCQAFIKYAADWESFVTSMAPEKKLHPDLWSGADMRDLKPLHQRHKIGAADTQAYLAKSNVDSQQNWQINGTHGRLLAHQNGHERLGRGDSNSSIASPYIPTTPLSAALGPAAQVTVPTAAPTSTIPVVASVAAMPASLTASTFDRSFRGNVFERADTLLSTGTPLTFIRNRDRGAL